MSNNSSKPAFNKRQGHYLFINEKNWKDGWLPLSITKIFYDHRARRAYARIYIRFLLGKLKVCLLLIWMMILQIGLSRCLKNNWTMLVLKLMHLLNFLFLWCQRQALKFMTCLFISPISFLGVLFLFSSFEHKTNGDKKYLVKSFIFSFSLYWFFLFCTLLFFLNM